MKLHVVFFFIMVPFFSCSMDNPLLLENTDRAYQRNAHEVQVACVGYLNFITQLSPNLAPREAKNILSMIGHSNITTEEKTAILRKLEQSKSEVLSIVQAKENREKEDCQILRQFRVRVIREEEEDRQMLQQFGMEVNGNGPKKRISRIR